MELDGCVERGMGGWGLGDAVLLCCGVGGKEGVYACTGLWGFRAESVLARLLGGGRGGGPGLFTDGGRGGGVDTEA
jgi:hypothetical protein